MSMQLDGWRLTHRVAGDWRQYPPEEWPVDISEGENVHASVIASNKGTADVTCTIKVWMEDATGATRGYSEGTATIKPGWTHSRNSDVVTLDKVGHWKLHGELWVGGTRIIKHNWLLLYCSQYVPPPPEGTVEFSSVYVIDETKHYYDIPVDLIQGAYIQGRHKRTNTNWVSQWMRTKSWLVDPDGQIRALDEGSWVDTLPGWTTGSGTAPIVLDKPGAWIMYAEVYAQVKVNGPSGPGTLVASGVWHIIDCHEPYVPPQGNLRGAVMNASTGAPIANALVMSGDYRGTTNAQGRYDIRYIPVGTYTFNYSAAGYYVEQREVTIEDKQTTQLDVLLPPYENGNGPPPPPNGEPEEGFPWLWVGIGAAVVAVIATRQRLKKG